MSRVILGLVLVTLLATLQSDAFSALQGRAASGYSSSSSYSSSYSSSSGSSSGGASSAYSYGGGSGAQNGALTVCCNLNSWAYQHMDVVRQFANRLLQEYNLMSQGSTTSVNYAATPWNANIIQITGKTASDLDALSRRISQQLVTDMRKGLLGYNTISQANFFEWKSARELESLASTAEEFGQQQQLVDIGHFQPVDLTNFDEVKNYAYPAEVKVIDGKTYVVHKNCTEATRTSGTGTYQSPLVSVIKRNHTIITTSNTPTYTNQVVYGGPVQSGSLLEGTNSYGVSGKRTTIQDWIRENMEPGVLNYNSQINVGQRGYNPSSTVTTLRRYNKTITSNSDGTNSVRGSESEQKWVNGQLVYDNQRPFGEWSVPRDEAWKREERERFFWFLTQGSTTPQQLEAWQRQQEERLLAMADRYQTSIEAIQAFHRSELERYRILLGQYQTQINDASNWQRVERGRLDWLIHQNSLTRDEFERWQRENQDRLTQLARQYRISVEELKRWQLEELNRLYVYFNDVNNSIISTHTAPVPGSSSLVVDHNADEQARLEELIRQHNKTIATLQNNIQLDQQKLSELANKYRVNVQDMSTWLKGEVSRITGLINDQKTEVTRITEWQNSERNRLENILRQHQGGVGDLQQQMARDRNYIQSLATKYKVSIEELEKWQRDEIARLQREGQAELDSHIKAWQLKEQQRLRSLLSQNDLTLNEFQQRATADRAHLEKLAVDYNVEVKEVEQWIKNEVQRYKSEGLLKEVEQELALWQQRERERLQRIVGESSLTVDELEKKIKGDQAHFFELANTYQVRIEDVQDWLKKELLRLQSQGLIKAEDLKDWQKNERSEILKIVQQNKLTIDNFETKLLSDRARLQDLSRTYNVKVSEIEQWIHNEGERLQNLGLLKMQEQLNNWQKIEKQRILELANKNNLSIDELENRIKQDQVHLYSLAHQHQVRVEEIEEWIKQEIKKLQSEGLIELNKLKAWQMEWRGNLTNMVQERDFTVEEFHKWLLEDRARLQNLAMQHNVQIEEIEDFVKREEQRFVSMGLLKPNEKLTNWQEVERIHLERLAQQQYKSTEQLEERLRQDRILLENLARQYSVQVETIEEWMKKELARLRDDGQLQIDNLTAWQIAERERLEALIKDNKVLSVEEFEATLRKDRDHMQTMAFQYHTSVEEIERWVQSEIERLKQQGKLNIEQLSAWQKAEQQRIIKLLDSHVQITAEEFEMKVQKDRYFLNNLADQYHVSVMELEEYIKKVVEQLRKTGQFELEQLKAWQLVERDYIKQLISQYKNGLSTAEYEQKLLSDRVHLNQLADQYRVNVDQIEKWMVEELKRLRGDSELQIQSLSAWQASEVERLKSLLKEHNHLTYVDFEVELLNERARLEELAKQYSVSVEQVESWLRSQLVNLKTTGEFKVENLTKWQESEQQRLIELLVKEQNDLTYAEFEHQLQRDQNRLKELSQRYHVSIEQIEQWMRDEVQRLKSSGLTQVEEANYWQRDTRTRLEDWLKEFNNGASYDEFLNFLRRDKARLTNIASDYHITVEEVEKWVQKEGARLQLIGEIRRPQTHWTIEEFNKIWDNKPHDAVIITDNDELWKKQTFGHFEAMALVKPMTWTQFEKYLVDNRSRWEQFARQYDITVEDIEYWLKDCARKNPNGSLIIEEWQESEQRYIQDLLNQLSRKQVKLTNEDLEIQLVNDRARLQQLATKYHLAVEQIEEWYRNELQKLLNQRRLIAGNLLDWQRREKQRLYLHIKQIPQLQSSSLQIIQEQLLRDHNELERLAREYHITVEELTLFIRNELDRLGQVGVISGTLTQGTKSNQWQEEERQRLRTIATDITITEDELVQFIAADKDYQDILANIYNVSLNMLAPFQRTVILTLGENQLFENRKLKTLQPWQIRERDRLYELIKNQNFNLRNLQDWQRQSIYLNENARQYGISVYDLKEWQLREFERLIELGTHYRLSLRELQDFRDKELAYLTYIMHKKTTTEHERRNWELNEAARYAKLSQRTELTGEELVQWRRTLYLLCQGLIDLETGGEGGHMIGNGSTNSSGVPPRQVISKDRGDQPPILYEETVDGDEPGLEGETPKPERIVEGTTYNNNPYLPPLPSKNQHPGGGNVEGYRYSKKEYKFTVPEGSASASASADVGGSSASANVGGSYHNFQSQSHTKRDEYGQQQQLDNDDDDDLGQQQEVDLSWNGKLQASEDLGQKQVEDLSGYHVAAGHGSYTSRQHQSGYNQHQAQAEDLHDNGQQQQQEEEEIFEPSYSHVSQNNERHVESTTQQVEPKIEVQAIQEPTSIWGKFKKKTGDIFG